LRGQIDSRFPNGCDRASVLVGNIAQLRVDAGGIAHEFFERGRRDECCAISASVSVFRVGREIDAGLSAAAATDQRRCTSDPRASR
jgi:hypothetical protein